MGDNSPLPGTFLFYLRERGNILPFGKKMFLYGGSTWFREGEKRWFILEGRGTE